MTNVFKTEEGEYLTYPDGDTATPQEIEQFGAEKAGQHVPTNPVDDELDEILYDMHSHGRNCFCDGQEDEIDSSVKQALLAWRSQGVGEANGSTSDGYHTFDELYEFRMLYNAKWFNDLAWYHDEYGQGPLPVKSKRHSDGELCFGGGWFVVSVQLESGQVTNHYKLEDWTLFQIDEVDKAPEWDGHSPQDVIKRLRADLEKTS